MLISNSSDFEFRKFDGRLDRIARRSHLVCFQRQHALPLFEVSAPDLLLDALLDVVIENHAHVLPFFLILYVPEGIANNVGERPKHRAVIGTDRVFANRVPEFVTQFLIDKRYHLSLSLQCQPRSSIPNEMPPQRSTLRVAPLMDCAVDEITQQKRRALIEQPGPLQSGEQAWAPC
jgi:hypothetical protein